METLQNTRRRPRLAPGPPPDLVGTGLAGLRGAARAHSRSVRGLRAVTADVLEDEVVGTPALLETEPGELDRAGRVDQYRRPGVVVLEVHSAAVEGDVVGVVDEPAVGRAGADALRVVVGRVVARQAGAGRAAAARYGDLHVGEGHVADVVAAVGAPDRRAVRRAALSADGDLV